MGTQFWLYTATAAVLTLVFRKHVARFLLGHHMRGRRTNYGVIKRADKIAPHARTVTRWGHASMLTRATIRVGSLALAGLLAYAWTVAPTTTITVLIAVSVAALAGLGFRGYRLVQTWTHRRQVVHPMAEALAPLLGVSVSDASTAITLPRTFTQVSDGNLGNITLPSHFQGAPDQRKAIDHLVKSRLPVDIETTWRTAQAPMQLMINASPKPPDMVKFAEVRAEMDACAPGVILLGHDRRRNPYTGSFATEDPHWGASVGSGRGKSSWLQLIAAQVLHQHPENTVVGVDPKMTSLDPLIGIPGVRVANDPRNVPGMWQNIAEFEAEMVSRMDAQQADPTITFPLALLIVDEVNQFAAMTSAVWRGMKEKSDPATAPVWMTIASILWQGRALNCHVILVGQRLDDRATGGVGLRDSLGLRALGGFTAQQWMMLVGTTPVPRSQKPRGRWIYSDGQETTWVQNVYGTPEEIRDYALESRRPGMSLSPVPDVSLPAQSDGTGTGTPVTAPEPAQVSEGTQGAAWIVGMAAGAAHLDLSGEAFKKRRQRAGGTVPGEMRQGNQPAWLPGDLDAWRETWPRVVAATETAPERSA
jgi:hypothetical protein